METSFTEPEGARLRALLSYGILDSVPEENYEAITRMAVEISHMPISTITLIDADRQWFKSVVGLPHRESSRRDAFCHHAIQRPGQILIVNDARTDERFVDNPLIRGESPVIFYAGVPLVDEDGYAIGTLCVIDSKPNHLDQEQIRLLHLLASQVMTLLTLRRSQTQLLAANAQLQQMNQAVEVANHHHQQTNQLLQAIIDHCPAGLILFDGIRHQGQLVDFQCLFTNPANARLSGVAIDQSVGKSLTDVFSTIGHTDLLERFVEAINTGQPQRYQQTLRVNQLEQWGEFTLVPLGDQLLVTFQDITPLKAAEDRLKTKAQGLAEQVNQRQQEVSRLNQHLLLATQASQLGSWSFDLVRDEIRWDETMYQLYGLVDTGQPLRLADYERLIHPEDRPVFTPRHQQPLLDQPRTNQQRIIRPDGEVRWMELHGVRLNNEAGEAIGSVGVVQDITDRKAAEAALLESELRFRQIAENVSEVIWIRDLHEARFLYMNRAYETLSGFSPQSVYEDPFSFLTCVLEPDRAAVHEAFVSEEPLASFRFRIRHRAGRLYWMEAQVVLLTNEQGLPIRRIGVATDITAAIEKEQILREALANEQHLNQLKSQFITTASHEFRTPLTSISSSTELAKLYLGREAPTPTTPLIAKHLDVIVAKVAALNELISDTLTISKIEAGKLTLQREPTDVVALCQQLIASTFGEQLDKRALDWEVTGQPALVSLDKKLINHVLTNLISNAFKFSTTNPRLQVRFEGGILELAIRDEGIGIPAADVPQLFNKFYRAGNASGFPGTGLGLVICQEYVLAHGGQLQVFSQEGVGSTFTVRLPLE